MLVRTDGPAWLALKEGILFVAFFLLCLTCFRAPHDWLRRAPSLDAAALARET
jgi:hypothetical protein